jgi:hypothetical protein
MSTDRQLLESAAKAAGIVVERSRLDDPAHRDMLIQDSARNQHQKFGPWNPLTDDGDALRLAVALQMDVFVRAEWVEAVAPMGAPQKVHYERGGREEATRRAIVRAAAALGEQA